MKDARTFGARHRALTQLRSLYHMILSPDNLHARILVIDTTGINVWCAAGKVFPRYSP